MCVLVDHDNIPISIRKNSPLHVADTICAALERNLPDVFKSDQRLDLRLYGGWYSGNNQSRAAQQLSAQINRDFPYVFTLSASGVRIPITINANLAHALVILPKKTLHDTFRYRPSANGISCSHPTAIGCVEVNCPSVAVFHFFNQAQCSHLGCPITPSKLVKPRGEQKLVDTMLVADLIYLAQINEPVLTVVSSDDDIWPGIISCMQGGTHIIHVSTKHHGRRVGYLAGVTGKYSKATL
jgi:hypothetical protein